MAAYPVRVVKQRPHHLLIQASRRTEVDIFYTGWALQAALSEPPLQRSILAPAPLLIHQQSEALFEAELGSLRIFLLLSKASAMPRMRMTYNFSMVCWFSMFSFWSY